MSNFIDLDSFYRDRETYPNENEYQISNQGVASWFRKSRSVTNLPQDPNTQPVDYVTSIRVKYLTLPYSDDLSEVPRVYIDFRSRDYKDINLISTIGGEHSQDKFICEFHKIQNDRNGDPLWIIYKCKMTQVMRFNRKDNVLLRISSRNGNTLPQQDDNIPSPPSSTKQSLVTFEIIPYTRDGRFDDHVTEPVFIS